MPARQKIITFELTAQREAEEAARLTAEREAAERQAAERQAAEREAAERQAAVATETKPPTATEAMPATRN